MKNTDKRPEVQAEQALYDETMLLLEAYSQKLVEGDLVLSEIVEMESFQSLVMRINRLPGEFKEELRRGLYKRFKISPGRN